MKICISKLRVAPTVKGRGFELCFYGDPSEEMKAWIDYHKLETYNSGAFTNIRIHEAGVSDLSKLFEPFVPYKYMDGFSPNLNKHLHIGHFSNLVLAKAFTGLGVAQEQIAILGDTLTGEVSKEEALAALDDFKAKFDFGWNKIFMASEMKIKDTSILVDGTDAYEGTKCVDFNGVREVAIKSDGSTSYTYQDISLAQELNDSTLYLTGKEQSIHFGKIKSMFPHIDHIGLGLLRYNKGSHKMDSSKEKMSSRLGNVVFISDFIQDLSEDFDDSHLIYNVFAGYILKSAPDVDKTISKEEIANRKTSPGLYLSYTMARLFSAGCEILDTEQFQSTKLQFAYLRAQQQMKPNLLFSELMEYAGEINSLYETYMIRGDETARQVYNLLLTDLVRGMKALGMFVVTKV